MCLTEAHAFFTRYRDAFNPPDGDAVADLWHARVQWTITRADGSLLQRFGTGDRLRRTAAGPRVLLCTAYQEDLQEMTRHAAQ